MEFRKKILKPVALIAALFFSLSSLMLPTAQAAMISTQDYVQAQQADWNKIELKALLDRAEVKQQLQDLGVKADDIQVRIDSLTDEELAQLSSNLQDLPAGGADFISLAVLIFIVLIITDALGATDLFPFVHPIDL